VDAGRDREEQRGEKKKKNGGTHIWRGGWRASRNGGLEGKFGGACKIEAHLEALMELIFYTKPLNFIVKTHMEVLTGVTLIAGVALTSTECNQSEENIHREEKDLMELLCSLDKTDHGKLNMSRRPNIVGSKISILGVMEI
jgi:hypothetical protein